MRSCPRYLQGGQMRHPLKSGCHLLRQPLRSIPTCQNKSTRVAQEQSKVLGVISCTRKRGKKNLNSLLGRHEQCFGEEEEEVERGATSQSRQVQWGTKQVDDLKYIIPGHTKAKQFWTHKIDFFEQSFTQRGELHHQVTPSLPDHTDC